MKYRSRHFQEDKILQINDTNKYPKSSAMNSWINRNNEKFLSVLQTYVIKSIQYISIKI